MHTVYGQYPSVISLREAWEVPRETIKLKAMEELKQWILDNTSPSLLGDLSIEDIEHVANCLSSVKAYFEGRMPLRLLGSFTAAIARRDLYRAFTTADHINMKCMSIYASWLYNCAPANHPEYVK